MERVALHLQVEANNRTDPEDKDLFGRTAYNRYYYSTFLIVRALLRSLDPKWNELPHADYPKVLLGQVLKSIKRGRERARKLDDKELQTICFQAASAAHQLCDLISKGSATRVVADYQPEIQVVFSGAERFALNGIDVSEAHQWPGRARALTDMIARAWQQIDE